MERWRVLLAKPGLDGHERGVRVVARALRDAGMEVIYLGLFQTPEQIAATAADEDVDAVGLSVLSGAHVTVLPAVVRELRAHNADSLVFAGGIIPERDVENLRAAGVEAVFGPGTPLQQIVAWLDAALVARRTSEGL